MKKALFALLVFAILAGLGGYGAMRYAAPRQPLDLNYKHVPIGDLAFGMVRRLSLDLILTEADVNNIGKEALAGKRDYSPGVRIDGARFRLSGGRLIADVNVTVKNRIPVGLTVTYKLDWRDPDLIAEAEKANVRNISLPVHHFRDIVIPLGNKVPKPLRIESVTAGEGELTVRLMRPSLKDLPLLTE
ncbi:hypothetical protein [Paenibacillus humicola]|uniref:hypothetical protein n=1 Tax=Paenibacillus humicola TaxID=3110540 RepID=UPI00237AAAC9|nr:hypothetical protein [Paenibacillus humicola]